MALPTREDHPRRLTARAGAARVAAAIALGASLLAVPSPATAQTQPFSDVAEGTYYSEPVARLADNDIFDGTECAPGLLCPETSIDRKTMAVWTVRALDGQDPAQASGDRFTDVDADSFHAPFIERMAELGVTAGCGDGTRFCPDRTVTRAQMAVFLTRAFSLVPGPDPGFTDVPAGAWYFDQLTALAASGITKGCGDGTRFCPGRDTTRAQMATFLYRALHRDEPETEDLKPPLGNFDVERLLAAAVTLDREAKCPLPDSPESLEDVAEVLRIADGCAIVEYLPLRGQTLQEVRAELFASDRTVHAVGSPLTDLQLVSLQDADYGQDPPPPYNEDEYDAGEWWHLDVLDAALLWNPDGWEYDDSSGNTRRISGWPDQADVIVTVIDTGVDDHRDFRSRLVESRGDGGQFDTWLDDDCHHSGDNAHGTHVSGLIAAEQGNGYATAGIAPLAQVLPINLLRESCYSNYPSYGNATASVWAAIDRGTYVINMSFRWYPEYDNQGADDVFKASLVVAQQQFDIVVVAAAGNCGNPKHFNVQNKFSTTKCPKGQNMRHAPQMYDSDELDVISVAAIRRDHRRTSFSTVNRDVDIAAPGHNLLSTHPTTCIISLCRDETVFMSGTSQAAPLVSGVVAHMRARYPQATPNEIATALYDTATHRPAVQTDSTGRSDKYGHGIINPKAAIEALDQMMWPDPITGPARYAEPFSRVAAGAIHTCALRDDDTVACWGDNQHGQADAPSGTFNAVSAGRYHSCALRTNGTLACWGLNDRGQADPPAGSDFRGVTSGGGHSCALKDDDTVACWGDNEHGQRETPAGRLIAISAGGDQSCAVRASGTVVCWGDPGSLPSSSIYDRFNAVSSGTAHSCGLRTDDSIGCWSGGLLDDSREVVTDVPSGTFTAISAHGNNACGLRSSGDITCWGEQLEGEVEGPFTAVTVGLFHMCATRPNGSVECRGDNDYGQTDVPPLAADSQSEATTHTPRPVGQFSAVSAGQFHSCGLRTNGTIQCWGDNNDGQTDAPAGTFSAVTAGGVHSCGLRTNGTIQCWGENYYGEADAPAGTFSAVTAGRGHSCGLRTNGTIQCWGENYYGEADAPAGTFSAVTAGGVLSCGLRTNGTIQCWGYNHDGQTDAPAGTFSAVSAGTFHSCGLRTNGTIQCWGGDGLADAPAATFSAVTAGSHSCGLRTNGTIQCWGNNYDGQTDAPEGTFNAVTAGRAHSCGLRTDGSIQCWGDNRHGQTDTPQPGS